MGLAFEWRNTLGRKLLLTIFIFLKKKKKRLFLGSNICEKWDPHKHLGKISTASSTHHINFPSVMFLPLKLITKYKDVETKRPKRKPYSCIHCSGSECHSTAKVRESWRHIASLRSPALNPTAGQVA